MRLFSISFACLFLTLLCIAGYLTYLSKALVFAYWLLSLFTFAIYALDKSRARKGEWRIKEEYLHLMALLGGWPGALIAQQILRHKSQKISFRVSLTLIILVNISVFIWQLALQGNIFLPGKHL